MVSDVIADATLRPRAVEESEVQRSIDDLVHDARQYRRSRDFRELVRFAARFRKHKPFHALLIHSQMPGAHYVATAARWRREFRRQVRFEERPIVALQPFGPVIFVYDVSQTESVDGSQLPLRVENAFSMPPVGHA